MINRSMSGKSELAVETYENIATIYADKYFCDLSNGSYIDEFLFNLPVAGCVLDAGCGPGQLSQYMMGKGFRVTGIDFCRNMITLAKKLIPDCDFRHMDMRYLDFASNSFDGILLSYSIIHIPSEELPLTLLGFRRILKAGGYIEIIAQAGEADRIVNEPLMPNKKMFFNFFTRERLSRFLEAAGFEISYQVETNTADLDSVSERVIHTIARSV